MLTAAAGLVPWSAATPAAAATGWVGPGVSAYGDAPSVGGIGGMRLMAPAVGLARTADGKGYWVASADGGVFAFGDAAMHGSLAAIPLYAPIVGIAATPDGGGYWLVAMDGGVFGFGDAGFHGSFGGMRLNQPIVGIAASPDGGGYWLVASDGGVFAFGDAAFEGSTGGLPLAQPITGIAPSGDGHGYWLVAADGGVFAFGDAAFQGSAVGQNLGTWVVGIAPTPDGRGYWLAAATGGVLVFGDAEFHGPDPNLPPFSPVAAIAATPDGGGYWLLRPDEANLAFSSRMPAGFAAGPSVVATAASQIGPDTADGRGAYCNPYGPCEPWCALFATWAWDAAGLTVPQFAFTGFVYDWALPRGEVLPPGAMPGPGDGVLYGTGPQSTATSVHMGVVAQVWPDGAVDTVEGDAGPEPDGHMAVVVNGPFLPAFSQQANGMPVYAFIRP